MIELLNEKITGTRYAKYRYGAGHVKIIRLDKLGKSDSDITYLSCQTASGRVRFCVTNRIFERLPTSMDEAKNSLSTPMPWKLREVLDPDILNLVQ